MAPKRYRRLAEEALDVARNFPHGEHRDALVQMAQVWRVLTVSKLHLVKR
jgi:hypothetical protein